MLKCIKCGSFEAAKVVEESAVNVDFECTICGREYKLAKIPIGKKEYAVYVNVISERLLHKHAIVESIGIDIIRALIIVGFFVEKEKTARIVDTEITYRIDEVGKPVPKMRILLSLVE